MSDLAPSINPTTWSLAQINLGELFPGQTTVTVSSIAFTNAGSLNSAFLLDLVQFSTIMAIEVRPQTRPDRAGLGWALTIKQTCFMPLFSSCCWCCVTMDAGSKPASAGYGAATDHRAWQRAQEEQPDLPGNRL